MERNLVNVKSNFDNKKGVSEVLPFSFSFLESHFLVQEEEFQLWSLAPLK